MFPPSCADMFDRTRLESAAATLGGMGVAAHRSAIEAARRPLDLGVGPMAAGRSAANLFPLARATRLQARPDVVQVSLDYPIGEAPVRDAGELAIVWFNLESLSGGAQQMTLSGWGRAPNAAMSTALVTTGRGGIVAAMCGPSIGRLGFRNGDPGFVTCINDHQGADVTLRPIRSPDGDNLTDSGQGGTARCHRAVAALGAFAHLISVTSPIEPATVLRAARGDLISGAGDMIIGVDDAHLLDNFSATLAHQLAMSGSARLVVTIRDGEPAPDAITALWKDEWLTRITLSAFTREQTFEWPSRCWVDRSKRRVPIASSGCPKGIRWVLHRGRRNTEPDERAVRYAPAG